jgi:hypothetical protein
MTTIANLSSVSDGLTKTKSIAHGAGKYTDNKKNTSIPSYSLSQGKKFEAYQKKVTFNLDKKAKKLSEGFQGSNSGLTSQSNSLLQETDINSQKQVIANLKLEYASTLKDYKNLQKQIKDKVKGYLERVDPNNKYLNKTVRFTTGHIAYVTNKGVVKYVPNMDIWANTGISTTYIDLNIPWKDSYGTAGTIIESTPPLIAGTFLQSNQRVGFEGSNVFVDNYVNDSVTATYQGCYADNTSSPLMTFIGDAPPQPSAIQNGNFENPSIANNSYQYAQQDAGSSNNQNSVKVPGWDFRAVLVNNSAAWGYPMPYPTGSQAACIQGTQQFSQNVYFESGVTYTLSFNACGRPGYSGANQINVSADNLTDDVMPVDIYNFTPPLTWTDYSTTFTVPSSKNYSLSFNGQIDSIYNATAIQNIHLSSSGNGSDSGSYTYDQCKQSALAQGYQYFALQKVNTSTSQGYCAVSNSQPTITSLGESTAVTGQVALWASNTSGQPGNTCILTTTGSLSVINSGGTSVWSSPASTEEPSSYIGCYVDTGDRAMPNTSNGQYLPFDDCKNLAAGYKYFATQDANGSGSGWCAASNDLATATKYGKASSCTKNGDNWMGSAWSNAVYSTGPGSAYFLSVQGDGNVCVYRGSGPSDNQGEIWCSETNGKGQSPNPAYAAANGKYGKDWISSGDTLASGDFVGSADGTFALIMQDDGNLVLYTYTVGSNCQQMADGNTGAGTGGNAIYGFPVSSIPGNMGKLAYVDENSQLHDYTDSYNKFPDIDSGGNDIPGAAYGNATVDQCKTTCNNNAACAGFAFHDNVCYPKTNAMYPVGASQPYTGCDTYTKNSQQSDNVQLVNTYSKFPDLNSDYHDIPGAMYGNATVDQCTTTCNDNSSCAGFVFYPAGNICYPKDNTMFPNGGTSSASKGFDSYIKHREPKKPPIGVPTTTNNLDTVSYQNYLKGGPVGDNYGLSKANSVQKQQLSDLETRLNLITSEINKFTTQFEQAGSKIDNQLISNIPGTQKYLNEIDIANKQINTSSFGLDRILDDSDIVVLQKNYDYLFWSILAVGTLLISMNIVKKT